MRPFKDLGEINEAKAEMIYKDALRNNKGVLFFMTVIKYSFLMLTIIFLSLCLFTLFKYISLIHLTVFMFSIFIIAIIVKSAFLIFLQGQSINKVIKQN